LFLILFSKNPTCGGLWGREGNCGSNRLQQTEKIHSAFSGIFPNKNFSGGFSAFYVFRKSSSVL